LRTLKSAIASSLLQLYGIANCGINGNLGSSAPDSNSFLKLINSQHDLEGYFENLAEQGFQNNHSAVLSQRNGD